MNSPLQNKVDFYGWIGKIFTVENETFSFIIITIIIIIIIH